MKITPDGEIVVRAPKRCPVERIDGFVMSHADWIERNRAIKLKQKEERDGFVFRNGDVITLCGHPAQVRIDPGAHAAVRYAAQYQHAGNPEQIGDVHIPFQLETRGYGKYAQLILSSGKIDRIRADFISFLREYGHPWMQYRLDLWSARMGIPYRKVMISSARGRWGSCNRDGVIRISAFLMMAPRDLIDYVLVHELCHCRHLDHGRAFWALVESEIPDWKERRARLKDYQYQPMIQCLAVKEG